LTLAPDAKQGAAGVDFARQPSDVRLDRVTKRFDDVAAVDGISLEIPRGSFFALLGPSGCGKTTTLRMIGGFEEPDEGAIFLGDQPVTGLPPHKRDVNTVFQSYALFPHLTIFENVAFGLRRKGVKGAQLEGRVREILGMVDLTGLGGRKPRQLSGGQQQRVALARALVNSPQVLLLDEPLGALDLKLRKQMQLTLKRIQHDIGITFIHVTHDQEEAMTMADAIAVMNKGRIEQLGAPEELYERPRTSFVARFLGASNLLEGAVEDGQAVRLKSGVTLRIGDGLPPRGSEVAIGIRPEKLRLEPGRDGENRLRGTVAERSYVGVATQYIVKTPDGTVSVFVQNAESRAGGLETGADVELSFDPDAAFVVDKTEEEEYA
jgi:spermidine/putrescine transport system ATP-binding protein